MYLGVDGGGTKTAFVLLGADGVVLARHTGPTCYHLEVGLEGMETVLSEGVSEISRQSGVNARDVAFSFFGIPGYGEDSALIAALSAIPQSVLGSDRYRCDNDMVCGWAAGSGGHDGVHIVAGTGSIGYGENGHRKARVGGWSELFGDEGSAYWIARSGLEAFSRMSDGRAEKTRLHALMIERLKLARDLDLCALVLNEWQASRSKIASLSKLVADAASHSDPVALAIFERAGEELALMVQSLLAQLQFAEDQAVTTTYSGGVFQAGDLIIEPFKAALQTVSPSCVLKSPDYSPDIGAALYAAKIAGHTFSSDSLERLKQP